MKILIVEDHQALREVMVEHLESQGHRVAGAAHADEMDTLLLQDKFDLLVLDLQLPGENGISIAQRLKRSQPGLYIIMMTARTSEADQVKVSRGVGCSRLLDPFILTLCAWCCCAAMCRSNSPSKKR